MFDLVSFFRNRIVSLVMIGLGIFLAWLGVDIEIIVVGVFVWIAISILNSLFGFFKNRKQEQ